MLRKRADNGRAPSFLASILVSFSVPWFWGAACGLGEGQSDVRKEGMASLVNPRMPFLAPSSLKHAPRKEICCQEEPENALLTGRLGGTRRSGSTGCTGCPRCTGSAGSARRTGNGRPFRQRGAALFANSRVCRVLVLAIGTRFVQINGCWSETHGLGTPFGECAVARCGSVRFANCRRFHDGDKIRPCPRAKLSKRHGWPSQVAVLFLFLGKRANHQFCIIPFSRCGS